MSTSATEQNKKFVCFNALKHVAKLILKTHFGYLFKIQVLARYRYKRLVFSSFSVFFFFPHRDENTIESLISAVYDFINFHSFFLRII